MKIYITGFMGAGKSTFGQALAEELSYTFCDLDKEVERVEGKSISKIFSEMGEEKFRKAETAVLHETRSLDNAVIATGGGTPCFNGQAEWLNENGVTVYLKLFESELKKRLQIQDIERPLLKDVKDLDSFIYETLRKRSAYYHRAKIVIDPREVSAKDLAVYIREYYK